MAVLERTYTIPLRKEYQKAPMYRRAKRAVNAVRTFLIKHMKSEKVKLGQQLNQAVWARGIKHPPHHVKVTVVKGDDGVVKAELFGFTFEEKKAPQPAEEKKGKKEESEQKAEAVHVHQKGEEHAHDEATEKQVKKEMVEKKEKKASAAKKTAAKKEEKK